jgi:hypothetical protein
MNIYQKALDVQDACNPSGVAALYTVALTEFRVSPDFTGTQSIKDNAALTLIAFKLTDLHGGVIMPFREWERAYETCKRLAAETVT